MNTVMDVLFHNEGKFLEYLNENQLLRKSGRGSCLNN